MASWNPWHGCKKFSAGCENCYVYRIDARHGKDASVVTKNSDFDLPVRRKRNGEYSIAPGGRVYTCFSSDFLLEEADEWRKEAFDFIRERSDLDFMFITKRIHRLAEILPDDWGDGYDNVYIGVTTENQDRADYRLPIFLEAPVKHRCIILEPLLERVDIARYLGPWIDGVVVGGESGEMARVCDYDWVLNLHRQCAEREIPFHFKQTGARFKKDGKLYRIPKRLQSQQARNAGLSTGAEPKAERSDGFTV